MDIWKHMFIGPTPFFLTTTGSWRCNLFLRCLLGCSKTKESTMIHPLTRTGTTLSASSYLRRFLSHITIQGEGISLESHPNRTSLQCPMDLLSVSMARPSELRSPSRSVDSKWNRSTCIFRAIVSIEKRLMHEKVRNH